MSRGAKVSKREAEEFAAMVRGIDPGTKSFRRYMLAQLRSARFRALMLVKEIEAIGVALKYDFIDSETAMVWLAEANALEFLRPEEADEEGSQCAGDNFSAGRDTDKLCSDNGKGEGL